MQSPRRESAGCHSNESNVGTGCMKERGEVVLSFVMGGLHRLTFLFMNTHWQNTHINTNTYAGAHKRYCTHLFTPQGEAELECILQSQWPGRGVLGPKLGARENTIRHTGSPEPSPPHKHDYWPFTATYRLPLLSQQIILTLITATINKDTTEIFLFLPLRRFFVACIPDV